MKSNLELSPKLGECHKQARCLLPCFLCYSVVDSLRPQPTLRFHSQLPKQERIQVGELIDLLGYWLACAVAGLGFYS